MPVSYEAAYLLVFKDAATGAQTVRLCRGALSLDEQQGAGFSGSFTIGGSPPCDAAHTGSLRGMLFHANGLAFDLHVAGSNANEFPRLTGSSLGQDAETAGTCVYTVAPTRFSGAVNEKKIVAISGATVDCATPDGGLKRFELRLRIDAMEEPPKREQR